MSESDKTEFMQDHIDLFKGEQGLALYNAFESGDYMDIEAALQGNDALRAQLASQIEQIDRELSVEMAKVEEEKNHAYIKYLESWKVNLENQTDFFQASLELLLEQEQAQLDIYKDFLEKQQKELEESLDKRKEAYEKYFEAINTQQEDEDYYEQSALLTANLAKLAASTDMASNKQRKELEQQLADLQEERIASERERTQQALVESIENEVADINNKFEELLSNEKALLAAMLLSAETGDAFLTNLLASSYSEGMTSLQFQDLINQVASAFGSIMDTSNIESIGQQIQNNATINVGNRTYDLGADDSAALLGLLENIMSKNGYGN